MRSRSISKNPAAKGPVSPGAYSPSTKVLRERKCSFARTSEGASTGVQTIPRFCASNATSSCTNWSTGVDIADDKWHLIVITVDRDSATGLRFYVDGSLASTKNPTLRSGSLSNDRPLRIGARSENGTGKFTGKIDEVQLYGRVLSAGEVENIYESGTNGLCRTGGGGDGGGDGGGQPPPPPPPSCLIAPCPL